MEDDDNKKLRVNIESEFNEYADILSEYYGIRNKAELFRFILKKEVRITKIMAFLEELIEKDSKEKLTKVISLIIETLKKELK